MDDPLARIFYAISLFYMIIVAIMLIPFVGVVTIVGPLVYPIGALVFTIFNWILPKLYPELIVPKTVDTSSHEEATGSMDNDESLNTLLGKK